MRAERVGLVREWTKARWPGSGAMLKPPPEEMEGVNGGFGFGFGVGWWGSTPWNQRITFSAEGLPNQYALVPSGSVTSLGVKPCFLANAGYASSRSAPI